MLLSIQKCTLTSCIVLGTRPEGNALKNKEPAVGFSFKTMLQHTSRFLVKNFLAKNNVITLEHLPYSPDLAPAHFYLFPLPISALKGRRCCDATDIIRNATEELKRLSQNVFQECFQHIYSPCQKHTVAQGDYFKRSVSPISAGPTLRRRCVVSGV
jgi:hypothetical protein